jgi:uncharacterized membrane protein YkoI
MDLMKPRHAAGLAILLIASNAFALTGEQYLPQATVPPAQARRLAPKTYPGKIISEELEKETGGSGLRYSFVIHHKKAKHEVGIDAKTGKVLENSVEGAHPE